MEEPESAASGFGKLGNQFASRPELPPGATGHFLPTGLRRPWGSSPDASRSALGWVCINWCCWCRVDICGEFEVEGCNFATSCDTSALDFLQAIARSAGPPAATAFEAPWRWSSRSRSILERKRLQTGDDEDDDGDHGAMVCNIPPLPQRQVIELRVKAEAAGTWAFMAREVLNRRLNSGQGV